MMSWNFQEIVQECLILWDEEAASCSCAVKFWAVDIYRILVTSKRRLLVLIHFPGAVIVYVVVMIEYAIRVSIQWMG